MSKMDRRPSRPRIAGRCPNIADVRDEGGTRFCRMCAWAQEHSLATYRGPTMLDALQGVVGIIGNDDLPDNGELSRHRGHGSRGRQRSGEAFMTTVFSTCPVPDCGGSLQATAGVFLKDVVVHEDGGIGKLADFYLAFGSLSQSLVEDDGEESFRLYCENDHQLCPSHVVYLDADGDGRCSACDAARDRELASGEAREHA